MTMEQFRKLKVGDMVTIQRGKEAGRLCQVAYIEENSVVVRSADGLQLCPQGSGSIFSKLRLTSWRELAPVREKD